MSEEKKKLHVAIVLDKSGSMGRTKEAAIEGFNEQVQQLKINKENGLDTVVSLVTFNGQVFEHLWCVPVGDLSEASAADYTPMGSTAMRDAMGYTIKKLMETTDFEDKNNIYLVIAISDGETNSDEHYSVSALKELIEGCQATDRWTFTHIGCDESYLKEMAKQTGIPLANYAAWDNKKSLGIARGGMKCASERTKRYCDSIVAGYTNTMNFMSDDSKQVADFTKENVVEPSTTFGVANVVEKSGIFSNTTAVEWKVENPSSTDEEAKKN